MCKLLTPSYFYKVAGMQSTILTTDLSSRVI